MVLHVCYKCLQESVLPPEQSYGALLFSACPSVCPSVRCCGHSNLVILSRLLPNFIYGLLPSTSGSSLNMCFVGQTITKMADKMAAAYQFAFIRCCGDSNLVIFNRISSKFHIWFASIKPWFKLEYEFCLTNYKSFVRPTITKMGGGQWLSGRVLDSRPRGRWFEPQVPNFIQISLISHWPNFQYGFCRMDDN